MFRKTELGGSFLGVRSDPIEELRFGFGLASVPGHVFGLFISVMRC